MKLSCFLNDPEKIEVVVVVDLPDLDKVSTCFPDGYWFVKRVNVDAMGYGRKLDVITSHDGTNTPHDLFYGPNKAPAYQHTDKNIFTILPKDFNVAQAPGYFRSTV